jgi:cation transporter-like permease
MPQLPVIIPMVVTGLLVGSVMRSESHRISKRRLGGASVLSGLLNGAQAYLVNLLTPQPTSTFFQGTVSATVRQASELTFTISSILVGILIPVAIVGIGMLYSRARKGGEEVEVQDSTFEK